MTAAILSSDVRYEQDVVHARQLARQLARLLGLDQQDQARISTAVSEIARNAFYYANGGRIEFLVEGRTQPQRFVIRVIDHGPGIDDLSSVLEGRYQSPTGIGLGIVGARRLMDHFEIRSAPGVGTEVVLAKLIPKHRALITEADVSRIAAALGRERPADPFQELRHQNQELMRALDEIRARQQELTRLNRELEDTNRGVVALYAELDDRADHLRRADELKSKFLSNMSHEFRSPLNSILALTGLLRDCADGPLTGEQEQQVNFIRRAAQDLLDLVNDLLDLAKVEAGKLEARPVEFEVADLFAALRGMLRPLLLNPSVDLVFEDASHIPPLFTDQGKLSQILRNFISNALKFTERGEVRVSAALAGDEGIELSVSDTGIGIAPEHQEVIFEDFFQLDHPIQHGVKGTGLGLPLSRRLATFLGGSVELRSAPGAGSTFTVRVPRNYSETPAKSAVETPAPVPDSADLPVLFIGDPEDILEYQNSLRASGFRLIIASTVRNAERALERLKPCAIVLDMIVHAESAWPLLAELRQASRTKGIPVIVAGTPKDRAKGFYPGADAWLMKPIQGAELLKQLRALTRDPGLRRVLIIDDSDADRYVLRQHLKNLPVTISEESAGMPGITRAMEKRPDLIFLDLAMPDMTGWDVLEELKRRHETMAIPVVVVTSRILGDTEKLRLSEKCAAIVVKDGMDESVFRDALRGALNDAAVESK